MEYNQIVGRASKIHETKYRPIEDRSEGLVRQATPATTTVTDHGWTGTHIGGLGMEGDRSALGDK